MPAYFPKVVEPKWQQYWLDHKTFRAVEDRSKPKYYILDMFPYPSGDGLHVGHPEGYTATDILARYKRMGGFNVLHPMGWDAFGLPAEQYAVETGTLPAITTARNIANFRRQIQMIGFSYDWDREVDTTDPGYYKWTQWIFLLLYDTWYDADQKRGRPISELSIPVEVARKGDAEVVLFRDRHRLAYLAEVPVNWCPALGTVLANEEVENGRSERGGHPVVRIPLRQWMLRITAYADRLLSDLDDLDWPAAIKEQQRNWIGRSEGAEVDFAILRDSGESLATYLDRRGSTGFPAEPGGDVIRVYTTRPDTLFGATYMVLAPEHPLVDVITTPDQRSAVDDYRAQAARKSDLDRTELAKQKTGVFTGGYAVNPVNDQPVPVWIADYVLMGYGTGAIMAVPAHDERDHEFAETFGLDIVEVVLDPVQTPNVLLQVHRWLGDWERRTDRLAEDKYLKVAILLNCGFDLEGFEADLADRVNQMDPLWNEVRWFYDPDEGKALAISYLEDEFEEFLNEYIEIEEDTQILVMTLDPDLGEDDDDLDSDEEGDEEEHVHDETCDHGDEPAEGAFTGEGIAVNSGRITGLPTAEAKKEIVRWLAERGLGRSAVNYKLRDWLFSRQRYWGEPFPILLDADGCHRPLEVAELPLLLPDLDDFQPTGTPSPPLSKAKDWLTVERGGHTFQRETNTMPQWAGSCWYFLRFVDPRNADAPWDKAKEAYWMPVDLYIGGAEHAVLHLLYSRFWHKVLHDRGFTHCPEPFRRLVNQGMILGETEFVGYQLDGQWVSAANVQASASGSLVDRETRREVATVPLESEQVVKSEQGWWLVERPEIRVEARAFKMSKSRGNVVNPDEVVDQFGADSLRLYEMFMGPLEATKPWSTKGVEGVWRFLNRVWRLIVDERSESTARSPRVVDREPDRELVQALHQTIKGVTDDLEGLRFNTAISKLMEYVNALTPLNERPITLLKPLVLMLAPFAPHVAEELWQVLGGTTTLAYEPWPTHDPELVKVDQIEVALQINNKVRSKMRVSADLGDDALIAAAHADDRMHELLAGKTIAKSFVVHSRKGKLVNFVITD